VKRRRQRALRAFVAGRPPSPTIRRGWHSRVQRRRVGVPSVIFKRVFVGGDARDRERNEIVRSLECKDAWLDREKERKEEVL
jgi:hypothetical protein